MHNSPGSVPPTERHSAPGSAAADIPVCTIPTPHAHSSFDDPINCPQRSDTLTATDLPPLLADIIATLKRAAESIPETRAAAKADPDPLVRSYRLGLVDGCESTIERVARIAQQYLERVAS